MTAACPHCGQARMGHDPCISNLPGVVNACCGHGDPLIIPYLTLEGDPSVTLYGCAALTVMRAMGGNPPDWPRTYSAAMVSGEYRA